MTTNDDGSTFEAPRPEAPPASGPPVLPPPAVGVSSPPFGPQPLGVQDGAPLATVVPTDTTGKRSKGKVVGGMIAVIALLGAGGFAVSRIVAGDEGGASNPTEVGTRLMDALGAEDALGVVDLLLPGERDTMRQPLIDLVDNLKRLEVAADTASLDKFSGIDLVFDNVEVETTATNVDDVSDIRITALGTASVDGEQVPIGDLVIDEAFGGDRPDLNSEPGEADVDWKLAAVKHDGRWYLSAFYSIAENARADAYDIPDTGVVARGADTAEGAVQAIFDAVADLDLEALIAALNPNEAEALQRYAPAFLDEAQAGIDDMGAKIAFSDTKYTVTGDGERRSVAIDEFSMTASADGAEVTVKSTDGCTVVTTKDSTTDTCEAGKSIDSAIDAMGLGDNEDLKALVATVQAAFSDMKPVGITVQQVNGKWFVSPIGTYTDIVNAVLSALDKNELTDIIDGVKKAAESFTLADIMGIGGTRTDEATVDIGEGDVSGFDACFDQVEFSAYSSCIAAGIDDGSIDPTFVAAYYRFDECGVGELYWNGEVYSLGDSDFTAMATEAAPCFQKYVADGTISEFELPYELSRPDCLEGRNWYNVTDPDYTDRVFECASS
ncbi:MAG: hypothetical protein ABI894_06925 [Ilumatobacteraceae bacterium]